MGQASGTITIPNSTLESYEGANISLMNNTNGIQSGGTGGSQGNSRYEYTCTWNSNGLIGQGWSATDPFQSDLERYTDSQLKNYFNNILLAEEAVTEILRYLFNVGTLPESCFTYKQN